MNEFFSMGGYGLYVWSSYAVSLILLMIPIIKVTHLIKKNRLLRKNELQKI